MVQKQLMLIIVYSFAKYKHKKDKHENILFLMITTLILVGCSKDEEKDEFYEKQITANEFNLVKYSYMEEKLGGRVLSLVRLSRYSNCFYAFYI